MGADDPAGSHEVTAACSLTTAKPAATVTPKVDAPSIDKKIVEGESRVGASTASIGDSVEYEITSKVPSMQGYKKVTVVDQTTVPTEINATGYVDANGVLTFEGLGKGTYTITELVAPQGYNLLKGPIKLVITADAALDKCTWTVTANGDKLSADNEYLYALTVENSAGTELPSTGGIGTTIFYIVGSLLAVGAVILLVTKKRMGKTED